VVPKGYYNYIYLDPRKPGRFQYEGLAFALLYEPLYVGKGKKRRYLHHFVEVRSGKHRNRYLANVIRKLQRLEYDLVSYIVLLNITAEEPVAISEEIKIIKAVGRKDQARGPLLNLTDGGDGTSGTVPSPERVRRFKEMASRPKAPEHLAQLPQNQKGYKHSDAFCEQQRLLQIGRKHPNRKKPSRESVLRAMETRRRNYVYRPRGPMSDEQKLKRSLTQRNRPKSEEWKKKASAAATRRWERWRLEHSKLKDAA
jgi:hypothetical protein